MRTSAHFGFLAMLIATHCTAHSALAAFCTPNTITPFAISNEPILATMQSWSLRVSYTDGDWTGAEMRATLPDPATQRYYKHALGGFTKPNPANFINFP